MAKKGRQRIKEKNIYKDKEIERNQTGEEEGFCWPRDVRVNDYNPSLLSGLVLIANTGLPF